MTFGSRFAGLGDPRAGGMPLYRYMGNRVTTVAENALLGSRFTELHSGMRAYSRRCLLRLPFLGYSDDFAFDSQLLVDAVTSGLRVVEVPIPTRYTLESSSISVKRSLRYVASSLSACCARLGGARPARPALARGGEDADGAEVVGGRTGGPGMRAVPRPLDGAGAGVQHDGTGGRDRVLVHQQQVGGA